MKTLKSLIILVIFWGSINFMEAQNSITLNQGWRFKAALPNLEKGLKDEWLPMTCPGVVHTALLQHGVIPDIFYRDNETKYQWLENEDWIFENTFDVNPETINQQHIELIFKGLDTYADVFLNSELILKADNDFRSWNVDVKPFLKEKGNILRIYFYSAVRRDLVARETLGYELPGGNRVFSRKPQFHYGWDWGPRFVSCGLSGNVELNTWSDVRIKTLNIKQLSLNDAFAKIRGEFELESSIEGAQEISMTVENQVFKNNVLLKKGKNQVSVDAEIANPKRWWSKGLGEAHLYNIVGTIGNEVKKTHIGLRTIELVQEKDTKGKTFYFKLNGVPVFMKGANYIPLSIFQDQVTEETYRTMIGNAAAANMNMLRVWGGGRYEDDVFYDICDEQGIMVWQDFMFACAMYPGDAPFLENVKKEAEEQVTRLHNHPCIALWCGNNENNEAWHNWGWQQQYLLNPKRKDQIWSDYQRVFNGILPEAVAQFGSNIPYWESSPSYGRYNPKSDLEGDNHYWGVWHDEEPFAKYNERVPRFMSEYGFQSFPHWSTIKSFTEEGDRDLETPVMTVHQKHPRGNTLMRKYMDRDYHVPKSFEQFVYVSQIVQAEGMRTGIEAHRRNRPYCMGTLYWQLNDVWPVASWSGIDGSGKWKALHYFAKESFQDVAIMPIEEKGLVKVFVVNDKQTAFENCQLDLEVFDFYGKKVFGESHKIRDIKGGSSTMEFQSFPQRLSQGMRLTNVYVQFTLKHGDNILANRTYYLVKPKELNLPEATISKKIASYNGGYKITLSSDRLAKNVYLQTDAKGNFTNNFFDLLPNQPIEISFVTNEKATFKITHLAETYK